MKDAALCSNAEKTVHLDLQFLKCNIKRLELLEQDLMQMKGFFFQLTVEYIHFVIDHFAVGFDGLFKIVNVDELDVKLVVQVFNVPALIFGEFAGADLFEIFSFLL